MTYIAEAIAKIQEAETATWDMAEVYLRDRDAHGIMDMGSKLEALQQARTELQRVYERIHGNTLDRK